jgi:hypothetical protein
MVQVFYTEGMLLIQHAISVPDRVVWSQLARSTCLQGVECISMCVVIVLICIILACCVYCICSD